MFSAHLVMIGRSRFIALISEAFVMSHLHFCTWRLSSPSCEVLPLLYLACIWTRLLSGTRLSELHSQCFPNLVKQVVLHVLTAARHITDLWASVGWHTG
ncbi:hypothetical protein BT67DRAFT_79488 [Trichocladium antarcticum]|uniref:Uncharacterized protein n=1 Tax=Trichocladium antarcticum TaxID=1450529 RepID=A0AAN6UGJ0_9PEZI|nr:hypothetical protein BT67DRAFT_79488 [Trichocladium antarcticum]